MIKLLTRFIGAPVLGGLILINLAFLCLNIAAVFLQPQIDTEMMVDRYAIGANAAFTAGCIQGTSYPPEYRVQQTGFNIRSPTGWCGTLRQEYFEPGFRAEGARFAADIKVPDVELVEEIKRLTWRVEDVKSYCVRAVELSLKKQEEKKCGR